MGGKQQQDNVKVHTTGDLSKHPHCVHGPTLLFSKIISDNNNNNNNNNEIIKYFACAACRAQNECKFLLKKSDLNDSNNFNKYSVKSVWNLDKNLINLSNVITQFIPKKRIYCHSCEQFLLTDRMKHEHCDHELTIGISDELLKRPTNLLRSRENDKKEAQYFFSNSTLNDLSVILKDLNFSKIICIGAPRLHEHLKINYNTLNIKSILLDFDNRYQLFNQPSEFIWYNMFNNHFFNGIDGVQQCFNDFLKENNENELIGLFTDPPFAGRTEPLTITIKTISTLYKKINVTNKILSIFWIFPYFMETYIKNVMPEMEMIDMKINYRNHNLYHNGKNGKKHGSPVRLFTNIPLNRISLKHIENEYKFCRKCQRWTAIENIHCKICNVCPSKNGSTYRHCPMCALCVKPNYKHCTNCCRCTQIMEHNCSEYQNQLRCWLCNKKGHNEINCIQYVNVINKSKKLYLKSKKLNIKLCFICKKFGHNEKCCKKRYLIK